MQHRPVVSAPCGVPYPFTALRRTGNRLGIGGAEQRPVPVGAISPDKGPAGGASNIGVLVLKELRSDRRSAHPMPLCLAWVYCTEIGISMQPESVQRFDFNYLSGYVVRFGRKKTASVGGWVGDVALLATKLAVCLPS